MNIVDDVERMINVISQLSAFQDLSATVPNVNELIQWSLDVLNFTRSAIDGLQISPEK